MEIINRLLEMSFYSVILFMAILVFKRLFKHKMSPALHFTVWFLLIARLCIPVTIDSGLKLVVIPEQTSAEIAQAAPASGQEMPFFNTSETKNDANNQNISQMQQASASNNVKPKTADNANGLIKLIAAIKWTDISIAVWLIGILLRAGGMASTASKMNRIISRHGQKPNIGTYELLNKCKKELCVKKDIPVHLLPNISTPALTIGFRPKIVLPLDITKTLSDEQLYFAIKHELMHDKRKDNIVSLFLCVLEAVYWFNPVIWLMRRYMTADMETACDSMVVKTLEKQGKKKYVLTLLNMFSQKSAPRFMLGMAQRHTEKIAEKRIRGVYMKNKSKRSVKLIAGIFAAVLIMGCFTTACQPTPEKEIVVNRNDLEEKIQAPAQTDTAYEASAHWTDTVERGDLVISADTDVVLPDVIQYPVTILEPVMFSQERIDEMVYYFAGDNKLFCYPSVFTKADYQEMLIEARRGQLTDGEYVVSEETERYAKSIEEMIANAPDGSPRIYTDTALTYDIDFDGNVNYDAGPHYLNVGVEFGHGNEATISAQNFTEGYGNSTRFSFFRISGHTTESFYHQFGDEAESYFNGYGKILNGITLDKDAARTQADKVISDLGIKDMALVNEEKAVLKSLGNQYGVSNNQPDRGGYVFEYVRSSGGIPGFQLMSFGTNGYEQPADYSPPFFLEMLRITVSENGIESFSWSGLAQVVETVSENVTLLPFEDLRQALIDQIYYEKAPMLEEFNESEASETIGKQTLTVNVLSAELRVGYISVKDNTRQAMLVPMWVFETSETSAHGDKSDTNDGKTYQFNAVDGGIIMPSMGAVARAEKEEAILNKG